MEPSALRPDTQLMEKRGFSYFDEYIFCKEKNYYIHRIYPNSVFKTKADRKRVYVSDELDECKDRSSLYFVLPFERGYLGECF